jgi:hypothetical protein
MILEFGLDPRQTPENRRQLALEGTDKYGVDTTQQSSEYSDDGRDEASAS